MEKQVSGYIAIGPDEEFALRRILELVHKVNHEVVPMPTQYDWPQAEKDVETLYRVLE